MKRLLLCLLLPFLLRADEYQLGNGYDLLDQLTVGGYISAEYKRGDDLNELEVDDLAVMGYGSLTHTLSYLVEFEAAKYHTWDFEHDTQESNPDFFTERAYLNYKLSNQLEFTAGKFITPGSYWNQVPINVLRDTTAKPELSQNIFPRLISGLGAEGYLPGSDTLKYSLFIQKNEDIDHGYNNFYTDDHTGAAIIKESGDLEARLWGGQFGLEDGTDSRYAGLTLRYEVLNTKLLFEAAQSTTDYFDGTDGQIKESFFLQGAQKVARQHTVAARYEYYHDEYIRLNENIYILAYNYRPIFPVSLKAEYVLHDTSANSMALFSFSILF